MKGEEWGGYSRGGYTTLTGGGGGEDEAGRGGGALGRLAGGDKQRALGVITHKYRAGCVPTQAHEGIRVGTYMHNKSYRSTE